MADYNYQKICQELLGDLPPRQKEVIVRRFALSGDLSDQNGIERDTLESIGQSLGITRERVRQIEEDGLVRIKQKIGQYGKVFQSFEQYLKKQGGFKKEEILLVDLAGKKNQARVYFLLTISGSFERFGENENFYSFWAVDKNATTTAESIINTLFNKLHEVGRPLGLRELNRFVGSNFLNSYLEISKKILLGQDGLYGLKEWPEINPRGVKDKAYLVLKKLKKPLHFQEAAKAIDGALAQTVHNELIKDQRFVLVGRGVYALREWGYTPGRVKDVIAKILKENGPLTQNEILTRTLKQRLVKESTVLLNLSNKKYFFRDGRGKYKINPEII